MYSLSSSEISQDQMPLVCFPQTLQVLRYFCNSGFARVSDGISVLQGLLLESEDEFIEQIFRIKRESHTLGYVDVGAEAREIKLC